MNLQLSLTTEWFEMTKTVKTEDYRSITPYWCNRLLTYGNLSQRSAKWWKEKFFEYDDLPDYPPLELKENIELFCAPINFTTNTMTLGYPKKGDPERTLIFEHAGIEIGYGNPEWGAPTDRIVFIIKHGKRIEL